MDIIRTFQKNVLSSYNVPGPVLDAGGPGRPITYALAFSPVGKQAMTKQGDVCCQGREQKATGAWTGCSVTSKLRIEAHAGADQVKQETKSAWAEGTACSKI